MEILLLTIFGSIWLAAIFVVLFVWDRKRHPMASLERDSLLPIMEEEKSQYLEKADNAEGNRIN